MLWVLLALTGAVTNAGYYVTTKKMLQSINPHVLAAGSFLTTALFLLLISSRSGIPVIGDRFLFAISITASLNIIATILTYRALATTDISLAIPMISFTPVFLIGTSFLLLHELPTIGGAIGILIIVSGSYVLNLSPGQKSIADPVRSIARHPGVLYMLIVAFLYAIAVNFDKMVVQESDTVFGSAILFVVLGSAFVIIALISCRDACTLHRIKKDLTLATELKPASYGYRYHLMAGAFIFIGILITIEAIVINYAYTLQIVPYVIAFKRMSIILTVLSGAIVFHESDIRRRFAGAVLMVLGAVLILVTL
jgi:drug/metabolite transporter (DMT)-like permease